jgi:hypothetical protein
MKIPAILAISIFAFTYTFASPTTSPPPANLIAKRTKCRKAPDNTGRCLESDAVKACVDMYEHNFFHGQTAENICSK